MLPFNSSDSAEPATWHPSSGPPPGGGSDSLSLRVNGDPCTEDPAAKPAYSNDKQVAAGDLHLSCAEVRGARATRWRRQSSASLGTKDRASQEDKGGRHVKPRWTAFQVRHLREEGNVMMGVIVDGHLDHRQVSYQSQRFWRVITWCLIWGTTRCHVRDRERSSAGYPGSDWAKPWRVSVMQNTSKFLASARAKYSSRLVTHIKCWCARMSMTSGSSSSTVLRMSLTLILRRSRTGTVWFYTSTGNKRAARPKLYTKSLTRDLKLIYSRFTLVRISINL